MSLSEDEVVQKQAAKVLGCLAEDPKMAEELFRSDVHTPMIGLMRSSKHDLQGGGLRVLASLALASDMVSACLLKSEMLEALQEMIRTPTAASVRHLALETLGNLAFSQDGKATLANVPGMRSMLIDLAEGRGTDVDRKTRVCSLRVLAILGQLDEVWRITGRPNVKGRGVRILTMDGGGMKGICTVALLREIERRTGRRISDLFDLVGGTSTGAMLGAAIGLRDFTLDQGADIYKKLGFKVFSQPEEEQPGWKESLYRMYRSGQQSIRVAMTGCKHDASTFEGLLQDFSSFPRDFCLNDAFIDTACLPLPRFFAVATLCTTVPSVPYLFRNYEFPPERNELVRGLNGCLGSSKHLVWEGIRASSAAPYYLVDFQIGDSRFQDGAVIANNPTAIAIQQARLLWPDAPIDCVVSLGVGSVPRAQREKSSSTLLENGSILIESACSVERVNEALLASLPMVPGLKYFRFNPVDVRCDMPLDSTDPEAWTRLEAATAEYIEQEASRFDEAATLLCSNLECSRSVATAPDASRVFLGSRRTITVVDCPLPGDTSWPVAVSKMCKGFTQCLYACTRGFPLELNDESPSKEEQVRDSAAAQNVVPILHEPSLSDWNTERQKHNAFNSEVPQASGDCVGLQTCFDPSSMPKFAAKDDYPSGAPLSNIQTPFTKCDVALSGAASPDSFGEQLQGGLWVNDSLCFDVLVC
ncbi:unnamed protein product [Ostreobium quekettii]|uniref:Patatin n=1 Tax=Ostreobium quekettii TaxID=121088 RepID=A0A8S1JFG0_9CHLO|nr:unnamed protein product [Ostreobium quekettii]